MTTGFLGGCAAETTPLPHSTKGNTDFHLGIFPHVYQAEFDLKRTELLRALYSCKTKQSQQRWGQHNLHWRGASQCPTIMWRHRTVPATMGFSPAAEHIPSSTV